MMRMIAIATAGAAFMALASIGATPAAAQAGVDVHIGDGPRAGVVVEPERRHHRDCKTVTVKEWRHGERVTRTVRKCD
jgi:hypothetical protein